MDPKIMGIIIENVATRGYDPQVPTFDILSHALLSAQIYTAAFHNTQGTLTAATKWHHKTIRDMDLLLQTLASWSESNEETVAAFHDRIGKQLHGIRHGMMNSSALDQGYAEEIERVTQDIPRPADMLNALPESIIPTPHRFHGQLAYVAYNALDYNTLGASTVRINEPKGWNQPIAPNTLLVTPSATRQALPQLGFREVGVGRTDQLLQKLLLGQLPAQDHTPNTTSPGSSLKRKDTISPTRSSQRIAGNLTPTKKPKVEVPKVKGPWKWTDPGANNRVPKARQACILLGLQRPPRYEEMVASIENKINREKLFDHPAANYGEMS
jgi:hypothetical protein